MRKLQVLLRYIGLGIVNAVGMFIIYLGQVLGYGFRPALGPGIPASERKAILLEILFKVDAILIVELLIFQTCMYLGNWYGLKDCIYKKQILIILTTLQVLWALASMFNFTTDYYNSQILLRQY